jgi:hypothetical protein
VTVPVAEGRLEPFRDAGRSAPQSVTVRPWGSGAGGTPGALGRIAAGPYERTLRLARRLTVGAPNAYAASRRIQAFLESSFDYSEDVPTRTHPLPAFLFEDRAGYCQQFSGAMALMLRLNGIPARVASGFAPGALDRPGEAYEVTDFDAHSWVEVYFEGIGWVTFDPTPGAAPPRLQPSSGLAALAPDGGAGRRAGRPLPPIEGTAAAPAGTGDGETVLLPLGVAGAIVVLLPAGLLSLAALRRRLRAAAPGAVSVQVAEIRHALTRLGWRVPQTATLLSLERRLGRTAPAPAAGYVAAMRRHLYEPGGAPPPDLRQRRAFRRAITASRGLRGRLRGWLAIPAGGPSRRDLRAGRGGALRAGGSRSRGSARRAPAPSRSRRPLRGGR